MKREIKFDKFYLRIEMEDLWLDTRGGRNGEDRTVIRVAGPRS